MSKVTARPHQATHLSIPITPAQRTLLRLIKRKYFIRNRPIERVAECLVHLALTHWDDVYPLFRADVNYALDEGFPSVRDYHTGQLDAVVQKGFVP